MGRTLRTAAHPLIGAALVLAAAGCAGGTAPAAAPSSTPLSGPAADPAAFCDAVKANVDATRPLNALNAKGPAPHPADEVAAAVAPLRVSYRTVLDTAPAEVRTDAERAYELATMQLDIYERTGGDASAVSADPAYVAKAQDAAGALQHVQDYTRTTCG